MKLKFKISFEIKDGRMIAYALKGKEKTMLFGRYGIAKLKDMQEHNQELYHQMIDNATLIPMLIQIDEQGYQRALQLRREYASVYNLIDMDTVQATQTWLELLKEVDAVVIKEILEK